MGKRRVTLLDSLRGFSLLGILMANLLIFQFGLWGKDFCYIYKAQNKKPTL